MGLNTRRYGRTRDQCPIVIERDSLVRDRDNDLERALASVLRLSFAKSGIVALGWCLCLNA